MNVMILSAGIGRRLLPLTENRPKPLMRVGGQTLIERHIERLVESGFTNIVINLFHLGDAIEAHLGTGERLGAQIRYIREAQLLETGGGITNALSLLDRDFLVVNGDIYTDFDFGTLPQSLAPGVLGHLVMVDNPCHHPDGDFGIGDADRLTLDGKLLTYSGISIFSRELFKGCKSTPFPLRKVFDPAVGSGLMTGEHYQGFWTDVGTVERFEELLSLRS
jgi:MurNAc alpha-1-phosphate uridylyltransferase